MAKQATRTVHMDGSFTYPLNPSQRRTLPLGWRGDVPAKVAKDIEAAGKGRIMTPQPSEPPRPKPNDPPAPRPEPKLSAETPLRDLVRVIASGLAAEEFTTEGYPEVDAINRALPEGVEHVDAAARDAVWDELKASGAVGA